MDSMLHTPPPEDEAEGIGFDDDKSKLERLKKDFLLLKKKIFCSQDLIQKYSTKIKENEKLKADIQVVLVESKQTEEKLKKQNILVQSDAIRLKFENEKLKQSHKELVKQCEDYGIIAAGDKQHIQQLICKITDIEEKQGDKLMTLELEKSGLQSKIKDLEREIRKLRKDQDKDSKSPKKAEFKKRKQCKTQKIIDLPIINEDLGVAIIDDGPIEPSKVSCDNLGPLEECKENNIIRIEIQKPFDFPEIVFENETKMDISKILDRTSSKPPSSDIGTITDEFYHLKHNPYPLFCHKCQVSIDSSPVDEILNGMKIIPLISDIPPSPIRARRKNIPVIKDIPIIKDSPATKVISLPNISLTVDNFAEKIAKLERQVLKMKRVQNGQKCACHFNHSHSNKCCHNNSFSDSISLVNMITTLCSKVMTNKKKKSRVKAIKRRKKKIYYARHVFNDWNVDSVDNNLSDYSEQNLQRFTPLTRTPTKGRKINHKFIHKNNLNHNFEQEIKNLEIEKDKEVFISREEREIHEKILERNNIGNDSISSDEVNTEDDCNKSTPLISEQKNSRKRKRKQENDNPVRKRRTRLLTKLHKLKNNKVPVLSLRNLSNKCLNNSEGDIEDIPLRKKRIAHTPKKIADDSDYNSSEINNSEEILKKRQRVTRSMLRSTSPAKKVVECQSINLNEEPLVNKNNLVSLDALNNSENTNKESETSLIKESPIVLPSLSIFDKTEDNCITSTNTSDKVVETIQNESQGLNNIYEKMEQIQKEDEANPTETEEKEREEESRIDNTLPDKLLDTKEPNKPKAESMVLENRRYSYDESPASPDNPTLPDNKAPDTTEETFSTSSSLSLYESVSFNVPTTSPVFAIPRTPEKVDLKKSKSQSATEYYKDCVKTLRSRTVSINPTKVNPLSVRNDSSTKKSDNPENSIESLLNQYTISGAKKKSCGAKQKLRNNAAIALAKSAEESIKSELQKLIDSEQWTSSINQKIVNNLKTFNDRSIAKVVVEFMINMSEQMEPLDRTFTPPAPMMSKSQQKIVSLLRKLDEEKSIICHVCDSIEYTLFRINADTTLEAVEELARIFTVLLKIKKDRERIRIMCCDALYCLQKKGLLILYTVIMSWPEILPSYQENQFQYLPTCIAYAIQMYKSSQKDPFCKIVQLSNLVRNHYNYPDDYITSKSFTDKLLEDLMTACHDKSASTAIILISKREGTEWTYKNVINDGLLKIIIENKSPNVYEALKLLGFLMRSFPKGNDGNVIKIIEQLCDILDSGATSADIQEGVVFALLSLSRHNFNQVADSIIAWHPPRDLSSELEEQLQTFFNSRTVDYWRQFKKKKKKH